MTPNADLAARARQRADAAAADRRAWLCAAVALRETRTLTAARKVLAEDCPEVTRAAALAALGQLAKEAAA